MSTKGKLIVLAAFVRNEDGKLCAFEPRQVETAGRARLIALMLGDGYAGIVAWSREAYPAIGEYGPPVVIYQRGDIPELE